MLGANSLLETGNMGFGMRTVFSIRIPIASFPFPGKRGLSFLRPIFPARPQLLAKSAFQSGKVSRFQRSKVAVGRECLETSETLKL